MSANLLKFFKLCFYIALTQPGFAQNETGSLAESDRQLSVESMQKDLKIFSEIREKANSGLYRYRTHEQIDSIYRMAHEAITKPLPVSAFYHIILELTDFEGSCHNYTEIDSSALEYLKKQTAFFPYALKYIGGKIIFNNQNASIPLGAQINAINGRSDTVLMNSFKKYITADGYVTTEKLSASVDHSFGIRYLLEYGLSKQFVVTYTIPGTTRALTTTISAVSNEERERNIKQRYSAALDDLTDFKKQPSHSFRIIDKQTALLNFRIFSMASGTEDPAFLPYVKFIDSVFNVLQLSKTKNLIIDLRGNPGGADPMFEQPMMYLTDKTFRENDSAYIIFEDVPFEQYFWGVATDHKMSEQEIIFGKQFLKGYFPKLIDGKNNQHPKYNPVYHPKTPMFRGKIYLLIDERVASAGSHLASLIKAYASNLTIVGVETCGGYLGHNGHMPLVYELPESKIKTKFSIVYVVQDAPGKPDQPIGRGIIPDHTVWQSHEDFMAQRDTQMEFVKNLIKTRK